MSIDFAVQTKILHKFIDFGDYTKGNVIVFEYYTVFNGCNRILIKFTPFCADLGKMLKKMQKFQKKYVRIML